MAEAAAQEIVLLVDDSPEALSFLTEALEDSGFSVLIATSGESAINIVDRIKPDIVLMDAVMPKMDGFETCRRLKSGPATSSPVIFMTGLSETEHIVHALESGGVDYLTKPINIDELRARIRVHLANARSAQSARVALDATGRHLLAAGPDGMPRWMTPQAGRLIGDTAGGAPDHTFIGEQIAAWLADGSADATAGNQPPLPVTSNEKRCFSSLFWKRPARTNSCFASPPPIRSAMTRRCASISR
nr:response regulator [Marinicella sp. W31]MDC2877894.1 response regulator [Marinicella sp. W31]